MVSGWAGPLIVFLVVSDLVNQAEVRKGLIGQILLVFDDYQASCLGSLLRLERRNLRADKEDLLWATGKRSFIKPNGLFLSMTGKKSMKPNGLFGPMSGKRAFKPNELFGTKKSLKPTVEVKCFIVKT